MADDSDNQEPIDLGLRKLYAHMIDDDVKEASETSRGIIRVRLTTAAAANRFRMKA